VGERIAAPGTDFLRTAASRSTVDSGERRDADMTHTWSWFRGNGPRSTPSALQTRCAGSITNRGRAYPPRARRNHDATSRPTRRASGRSVRPGVKVCPRHHRCAAHHVGLDMIPGLPAADTRLSASRVYARIDDAGMNDGDRRVGVGPFEREQVGEGRPSVSPATDDHDVLASIATP